jgi:hypothetical protein
MSHYASELLVKERIANWHSEANGSRLVRANPDSGPAARPAGRNGLFGPVGRLTGWLGQARLFVERLASAA